MPMGWYLCAGCEMHGTIQEILCEFDRRRDWKRGMRNALRRYEERSVALRRLMNPGGTPRPRPRRRTLWTAQNALTDWDREENEGRPPEWVMIWSEQHTEYYFWHQATRRTQWEDPLGTPAAGEMRVHARVDGNRGAQSLSRAHPRPEDSLQDVVEETDGEVWRV